MSRSSSFLLAALLGIGAIGIAPALAAGRRPSAQEQEAQALARLSLPDLRSYFEARRQIERRSSDQRLAQLRGLESCLERTRQRSGSVSCLEQAAQQREFERAQQQRELAALRGRYQLPSLDSGR
ncbi:MAG: hypothetical protein ACO3FK_02180 [Vulcanococcus sp.]